MFFAVFADLGPNRKIKFPQNFSNTKNNSQIIHRIACFLSSEKSTKLNSHKKSQNWEPQKLVPVKISSLIKVIKKLMYSSWSTKCRLLHKKSVKRIIPITKSYVWNYLFNFCLLNFFFFFAFLGSSFQLFCCKL